MDSKKQYALVGLEYAYDDEYIDVLIVKGNLSFCKKILKQERLDGQYTQMKIIDAKDLQKGGYI